MFVCEYWKMRKIVASKWTDKYSYGYFSRFDYFLIKEYKFYLKNESIRKIKNRFVFFFFTF